MTRIKIAFILCMSLVGSTTCVFAATSISKMCVTSKNSLPCPDKTAGSMYVDQFNGTYGTTWEGQKEALGKAFCTFKDSSGVDRLAPFNVAKVADLKGGEHGTAVLQITCN